jgi:hypothetical protein
MQYSEQNRTKNNNNNNNKASNKLFKKTAKYGPGGILKPQIGQFSSLP